MTDHTEEPWRVGKLSHPRDYEKVRETAGPLDIVVDTETGLYVLASCNLNFPEDAKANARRIVACVNACAGISTENLEQNKPIKEGLHGLNDRIRTAEKHRDELLTALEFVVNEALNDEEGAPGTLVIADAIEVIEKVKGGEV